MTADVYDAIVVGGGPAGSISSLVMARKGLRVLVLDRTHHPRFRLGESFMPRVLSALRELGLEQRMAEVPHVVKLGAEFGFAHDDINTMYWFGSGFPVGETDAFNLERAPFDAMLFKAATEAGVEASTDEEVKKIDRLEDGDVAVTTDKSRTYRGRYLLDATGPATLVGRQLGLRKVSPGLKKVAYYGFFENVARAEGPAAGHVIGVMCKEGWFWIIPLSPTRTSIGLVVDAGLPKQVGVPPDRLLEWAVRRAPQVARRCANAVFPERNSITADFTYTCRPYAGPGYFLLGDAAAFVDPIFSTGACLAIMSARRAGESVAAILREGADPAKLRKRYIDELEESSSLFFRMVHHYYDHTFRELFLRGTGPFEVHRALSSLLAGHVFPAPSSVRWRLELLDAFVMIHRYFPLVKRRQTFSLVEGRAVDGPRQAGTHLRWDPNLYPGFLHTLHRRLRGDSAQG